MHRSKVWIFLLSMAFLWSSCSVISREVRHGAMGPMPFKALLSEAERYKGETVILGGYILETRNSLTGAVVEVLQTPLSIGDEPKSKDYSQGRFLIFHKGFLDPEVYSKERKITVAGIVKGAVTRKVDGLSRAYLQIEDRELYLWPEREYFYYPIPYYDPWYYWDWPYFYGARPWWGRRR